MTYIPQKTTTKQAANSHLAQAGILAHQVTNALAEGESADVAPDAKNLRMIQVSVPLGQTWVKGDVVYRAVRGASWIKWDGNPLPAGTVADIGGVVHGVIAGIAQVQTLGSYSAANFTNFALAQAQGIIHPTAVSK